MPKKATQAVILRETGVAEFTTGDGGWANEQRVWLKDLTLNSNRLMASNYPNIDQLWPERFTNQPERTMAINSQYLGTICKLAAKYSPSSNKELQWDVSNHITPTVWRSRFDARHLGGLVDQEPLPWEVLAMPVQIRG